MMAAFALLLAACGSDASGENAGGGFPADTTCGLAITSDLGNITAQTSVACATLLAFDAGFNNKNSFNRAFRQVTGETPSAYWGRLRDGR